MKLFAKAVVIATLLLSACGTPPPEGAAGAVTPSEMQTSAQALQGACSITLYCQNGTHISCSGSSRSCALSSYGLEYVYCDGVTKYCTTTPPIPDCVRTEGHGCNTDIDCGESSVCNADYKCGGCI